MFLCVWAKTTKLPQKTTQVKDRTKNDAVFWRNLKIAREVHKCPFSYLEEWKSWSNLIEFYAPAPVSGARKQAKQSLVRASEPISLPFCINYLLRR